MLEIFGIDVAKWNGTIDWSKVNTSFAICKITKKNNSIEDSFERNYQGATAANIAVGGYRYVYAKNVTEALKEARGIADACRGKSLQMGIWLDMEDKSIKEIEIITDMPSGTIRSHLSRGRRHLKEYLEKQSEI